MGREVRKVKAGWEHPKSKEYRHGGYQPLYDQDFQSAAAEWKAGFLKWESGDDPDRAKHPMEYWEWSGNPPDPKYYRPKWTDEERTHFQLYETVSEGTPLSPPFPTLDELARWLAANGDYWAQQRNEKKKSFADWMAFLRVGWAPSGVMTSGSTRYEDGVDFVARDSTQRQ
jgi:hypothetical protein